MQDVGICDGDILIIDKSLEFENNCIAVAHINGEFTVKQIRKDGQISDHHVALDCCIDILAT